MKRRSAENRQEMRPEYDLDYAKAVRGKYLARLLKEGSNVVVLDADVAQRFRTSAAVNKALRKLLKQPHPKGRATRSNDRQRGTAS